MGTRSRIIAKLSNGKYKFIYCHWDGYPENNGRILNDHYQDQSKIDALIALGDLSSLGEEIGEKHGFDKRPEESICTAYGRDRGETGTEAKSAHSLTRAVKEAGESGAEFVYIWDGQRWEITTPEGGPIHPLIEFMKGGLSLDQEVKAFGGNFVIAKRKATAKT